MMREVQLWEEMVDGVVIQPQVSPRVSECEVNAPVGAAGELR
eukprot:CAMPEP_0184400032 /NCGR_PEP_ID=MMETSP0007-20130409/72925_1 /TAXON_ID=97485 /ORGANISM="Prymnesium parvum, Strain Texoma1" /LENGTH=41 /DNA_ID= /DNA_START= /DNA_END= /DNA_ORIENTATION=